MSEENKAQNRILDLISTLGDFNLSNIPFIKDNTNLIYVYKKLRKLISATYILTNFISDKEPAKWQLRATGLELLSLSLSLSTDQTQSFNLSPSQFKVRINPNLFVPICLKFISYLEVAFVAGFISKMNFDIIKYEIEELIKIIDHEDKISGENNLIFSNNFFDISKIIKEEATPAEISTNSFDNVSKLNYSKGHNTMSDRMSLRKNTSTTNSSLIHEKDKSDRQIIIVSLLKKNKELSIKDFTSSISGCSEKTIQRELAVLVSKGQIKKTGEKRWSRYSLR